VRERSSTVDRVTTPVRAAAQRFVVPLLVFLSAMLMVLGKADVLLFDRMRIAVGDATEPLLHLVSQPLAVVASGVRDIEGLVGVYRENERLREENARLLQWQTVAQRLGSENAELRGLLNFAPERMTSFVTAEVIDNSGGAFARNVLVDAGSRDGVRRGQAAVTGEGLVGRVAEVGERSTRILLLTDLNSRIPVMLEPSRERAVMAGDNSDRPQLLYLRTDALPEPGDRVVTGGSGGVFPAGLPVGFVASVDAGVVKVEPFAELRRLEYLRIVNFGLDGVLPQSAVPQPRVTRGPKIADPDTVR
jgi:rod shape-determining protein MreC